jgi:hypothetical protein
VRSRRETRMLPGVLLLLAVSTAATPASVSYAAGPPPSAVEISKALEAVKKDPNLDTEVTVKTLRWIDRSKPKKVPDWALLVWLRELVRWFERSARVLMWAAVATLAVWLAIYIIRLVRGRARRVAIDTFVAPTHVRDLDIRPEALPPNIGAAARALWERGEHRAALALLYRGLLSRLVHKHRVPIQDSSTEGDCLALAANHLNEESRRDYAAQLIRVWQRAVYGSQDPAAAAFYELCEGFAQALDRVAAGSAAGSASASPHGGGPA